MFKDFEIYKTDTEKYHIGFFTKTNIPCILTWDFISSINLHNEIRPIMKKYNVELDESVIMFNNEIDANNFLKEFESIYIIYLLENGKK